MRQTKGLQATVPSVCSVCPSTCPSCQLCLSVYTLQQRAKYMLKKEKIIILKVFYVIVFTSPQPNGAFSPSFCLCELNNFLCVIHIFISYTYIYFGTRDFTCPEFSLFSHGLFFFLSFYFTKSEYSFFRRRKILSGCPCCAFFLIKGPSAIIFFAR